MEERMTWQEFRRSVHTGRHAEPPEELDRLAYNVIGAAIEVHRVLGPGHPESAYEKAMCIELELRGIPFSKQVAYDLKFKGRVVGEGRIDLLIASDVIVELKACEALAPIHAAQLLSYLRATGKKLGLLINFNVAILRDGVKREIAS
jgi:GxxExxY protein